MQPVRFNPGFSGNNPGCRNSKKTAPPIATREPKAKEPKEFKAHNRPILHVHADGKRKGIMVIPKEIAEKCGADAATIMGMISTHAPTFQHCYHSIAAECGMSLRRVSRACVKLMKQGYACRAYLHGVGKLAGSTLQTNANGNIQPLRGSVLPYYCEDATVAVGQRPARRKAMRRAKANLEPQSDARSFRKTREHEAGGIIRFSPAADLTGSEVQGSEESPLASPIMLTPLEKEKEPQTPSGGRGLSSFIFTCDNDKVQDSNDLQSIARRYEAALNSPELQAQFPMNDDMETHVVDHLAAEVAWQQETIDAETTEVLDAAELIGVPATEDELPARVIDIERKTFVNWRRCNHLWGQGTLDRPWEMQAALDLGSADVPYAHNSSARPAGTSDNSIARALLAPRLCFPGFGNVGTRDQILKTAFHGGYQWLSNFTNSLEYEDPPLGLEDLPRYLTQGDNALLWMRTHRIGLVFLSSVTNPDQLTSLQAGKLVRKLRKGTVTERNIFRLWLLTHYGNMVLTVEEACEVLRLKHGMELNSDEAIEGYRLALRRMRDSNALIAPKYPGACFNLNIELDGVKGLLASSMRTGKQLIGEFIQAMGTFKDVEMALRQVRAAGAHDGGDTERLACMWLQAHVDQNDAVLDQLRAWGVRDVLKRWITNNAEGRQWIISVGLQWEFAHLPSNQPSITQTLGWASDTEWWLLNELRHYAMKKAWEAFVDIRGFAHTIWSNSLLDRKD